MKFQGMLSVHVAVLLFGIAGLFGEWVDLPAHGIVLGRTGFAFLFLWLVLSWRKIPKRPQRNSEWTLLIGSGALLAFHWVAFFQSIQLSSVAIGLLTFSSFPVFTVFLEALLGQEKLLVKNVSIATVTVLGVGILLPPLDLQLADTRGAIWGLLSGLSFAGLALVNRSLVAHNPSQRIALWQDLFAFLFLIPFGLIGEGMSPSLQDWGLLLLLGILFTGVSHALFIHSLKSIPPRMVSIITSLEPLYGILAAWMLLDQVPAPRTLLGGSIILGATTFASLADRKQRVDE